MKFEQYRESSRCAVLTRDDAGVLTIRLHRQGGPPIWGGVPHAELPELFAAVASDRENRVVILIGTGDTFIGMTGTHFGPDLFPDVDTDVTPAPVLMASRRRCGSRRGATRCGPGPV
jgi:hypothetical protein